MDNKLLFELSSACCITGEGSAADVIQKECEKYTSNIKRDALGNVIAVVKEKVEGKPNIFLEAHMDEVGFVVTSIDEDGFLRLGKVGGPDIRTLLGHEVTIHSNKDVFGVICCRPPHLSSKEDYKVVPKLDEIAVDIGYTHDKATKIVKPGDFVTYKREPKELLGGMITGKSLDNRAGCAVILRALELIGKNIDCGLSAGFTLHEELGGQGAKTAAFSTDPTHSIVVDVSFGSTPDAPKEKCGEMGKGPMIGIAPILSREVTNLMFKIAKEKEIPYQTEVMSGSTGTNADAITISREGVKTGLISVPLRYMHTAAETIVTEDVELTARLMAETVLALGRGN